MNQEVKSRWVAALESGKYEQGTGFLRGADSTFCCLGVLCEVHRQEVGGRWVFRPSDGLRYYRDSTGVLPHEVMVWAGLGESNPGAGSDSLAEHNDNGHTFSEIAGMIREYL